MRTIAIIGAFSFKCKDHGGQTVKTETLAECLKSKFGSHNVYCIDTVGFLCKLLLLFKLIKASVLCYNIIILPAQNGLKFIPSVLVFVKRFLDRKLHYVVIGGWLPIYLQDKKRILKSLKSFDGIYVETISMQKAIENLGIKNTYYVPNCRKLNILNGNFLEKNDNLPLNVLTFSRVTESKGIEDAIEAVKMVNSKYQDPIFTLHIYGQVFNEDKQWFESLICNSPSYIEYKGVIDYNTSSSVLKKYHSLIFPTFYEGEGFAGTLLDAFSSGLPVIASNWKYNSEIVKDGQEGLIYTVRNIEELADALEWSYINKDKWNSFRSNCLKKAYNYLPDVAYKPLFDRIKH